MNTPRYRAWHKEERRMYSVRGLNWDEHGNLRTAWLSRPGGPMIHLVEPNVVVLMQYIRRKDCKGVEIYEGDIVVTTNEQQGEYPVEEHYQGVVTYCDGSYNIKQSHDTYTPTVNNICIVSTEIIGNIYEHPQLCWQGPQP